MIEEAMKCVAEMTRKSTDVKELVIKGESPGIARIVKAGGEIEVIIKKPPHRFIELYTMADVLALASKPLDANWTRRAVFFSLTQITIVMDWENGYELARLELPETGEASWMKARLKEPNQSVGNLVTAFQTVMRRTRPQDQMERFVDAIGKLASSGRTDASAEASRGRVGISRTVLEEIQGPENLPQEMQTFEVRPFAVPDLKVRVPVLCTLLPLVTQVQWRFQPVEDSWLEFQNESLTHLRERLAKDAKDVPAYCGRWDVTGK